MRPEAVFLDLDGVINDPVRLPVEYARLMGDILAPVLGGSPEDWGNANRATFPALLQEVLAMDGSRDEIERWEFRENIRRMCAWLGIEPPPDNTCVRLGRAMNQYVRRHGRFTVPGAGEAIRELARHYRLHTATGSPSWMARANLEQLGVSHCFGMLCGPDLIDSNKWHDEDFYSRLFAAAGIEPGRAIVVDDRARMLERARAAGARTVLVTGAHDDGASADADLTVAGITALPAVLARP